MSDSPPPEIVGGADVDPSDLRWHEKAEELEFEALAKVTGAAEKWGASIAAILGLASTVLVVKGREDIGELTEAWQVAVGVILLLALIAAVVATVFAAYAAQGTPKDLRWPSGARLRASERAAALRAKLRLRWSRLLALVAVTLLAAAVAATWFGEAEPKSAPELLLIPQEGPPLCGTLARMADGGLAIQSGETAVPLPRGPYTTAPAAVSSCPKP